MQCMGNSMGYSTCPALFLQLLDTVHKLRTQFPAEIEFPISKGSML